MFYTWIIQIIIEIDDALEKIVIVHSQNITFIQWFEGVQLQFLLIWLRYSKM